MSDRRLYLTFVEIDVDHCSLTYGESPCTAELGVTGAIKCFNSLGTCQDRENFSNSPVTYRFAKPCGHLPKDIDAIPNVAGISIRPARVSLGRDSGSRASVEVEFTDHPWSDLAPAYDKYASERGYDARAQGSYWGKFRVRNPHLRGRAFRVIYGFVGQTLEEMERHHYIIESYSGPTPDGRFTIIAKDVLKSAGGDRSQAPRLSEGRLLANISSGDASLTLTPTGIGSTYRPFRYAAIGGKEIVGYTIPHTHNLVLNFQGVPGQTDIDDESASQHAITVGGNAQLTDVDAYFGLTCLELDGSANTRITVADHADFDIGITGNLNFQIDIIVQPENVSQSRGILAKTPDNAYGYLIFQGAGQYVFFASSNGSSFDMFGASFLSLGPAAVDTWAHLRVVRNGSNFYCYNNGVLTATYTEATAFVNNSAPVTIGSRGPTFNELWIGKVQSVRIIKGAFYEDHDVFPEFPEPLDIGYGNSDTVAISRGELNTTAQAHSAGDRVQECLFYSAEDPANILWDLLVRHANVPVPYINLKNWRLETAAFLQVLYTACIAEPVAVDKLISELAEQAALAIFWDDVDLQMRLQVLRKIATTASRFDETNISEGTLRVFDQPDLRVSEVWTYFALRNPLEPLDNTDNYRSVAKSPEDPDSTADEDYGTPAIKKIFSRFIPFGNRAGALRVNSIQLARYRDPPRRFEFDVGRVGSSVIPLLGVGYQLRAWPFQDQTGAPVDVPFQLTELAPHEDHFALGGEEVLFSGFDESDLLTRSVIIDSHQNNVNLKNLHDSIYPVLTDADVTNGVVVECVINTAIVVGSTSTAVPAFDVGTGWPSGLPISVQLDGRIQGRGGQGGAGGVPFSGNGQPGLPGGPALYTRVPIDLIISATGQLWSGGGGGGGGGCSSFAGGGGGGGGAGSLGGPGGAGGPNGGSNGSGGDAGGGGAGGGSSGGGAGGPGGGPGQSGSNGSAPPSAVSGPGAGAPPGNAINGVSFVTLTNNGSILGPQVN